MIKISYKEPEEFETYEQIAQQNIKLCDKYKKADYLELSCLSWLKLDSNRNYQDLEKLLRELDVDSYIVSKEITSIAPGLEINYPNGNTCIEKLEYVAKITCRSKQDSINELLSCHKTYEDNFECLKKTGCLMAIKKDINKEEEEKISKTIGTDEVKKLLECKLKLELEYYKPVESIGCIIESLTTSYGKTPEKVVCGEINKNKVYSLMLDGEIVSPIGWIEKIPNELNLSNNKESNEKIEIEYELIDFRKFKLEKQ